MPENIPDLIGKLRREPAWRVDEFVANRLSGPTTLIAEMTFRAHFVTALREAKLWPALEREP